MTNAADRVWKFWRHYQLLTPTVKNPTTIAKLARLFTDGINGKQYRQFYEKWQVVKNTCNDFSNLKDYFVNTLSNKLTINNPPIGKVSLFTVSTISKESPQF